MGVRKRIARTIGTIVENDIKIAITKGKKLYKDYTNEFYIYETQEGSGHYFPENSIISDNYIQHWKLSAEKNRWECLENRLKEGNLK
jgi:hypothetical protein